MSATSDQLELDYAQAAQYRVTADTLVLEKQTTLLVPAESESVPLPDEVIRISAMFTDAGNEVLPATTMDYLLMRTGGNPPPVTSFFLNRTIFVVIGRTLYVWPAPPVDTTFTVIYSYRSTVITSASPLEVSGIAARLVGRLAEAYALFDDGQPELAQAELGAYIKDAARVKRLHRRSEGRGSMLLLAGRRRR